MSYTSTVRSVFDKFVIDDDDMDSDTESNLSLKSRSFLHRVNDRLRKILDHSSTDAMQDIDKLSLIWRMFMSSTLEASIFMGIKCCLEEQLGWFKDSSQYRILDTIDGEPMEFEWNIFLDSLHCRSPKRSISS